MTKTQSESVEVDTKSFVCTDLEQRMRKIKAKLTSQGSCGKWLLDIKIVGEYIMINMTKIQIANIPV